MKIKNLFLLVFTLTIFSNLLFSQNNNSIPISAPVTIESPGKMGNVAIQSVMRIVCTSTNMGGTGFLYKSGWVITAAHVIADCNKNDLLLILSNNQRIKVDSLISDSYLDLGAIKPHIKITAPTLQISSKSIIATGEMVTTWGFPAGYNSLRPLLTVGYLSGIDRLPTPNGLSPERWVVNAAFNGGNSGGPVLDIQTGAVIGIVSSKLAPIPEYIESALVALSNQTSGFMYTKTNPDGTKEEISEGKVISDVLKYLRSQTQLVLGHAVTSLDLITFLKKNNIY